MDRPGGRGGPAPEGGGPAAAQRRQAGGGLQGQSASPLRFPVVHPVGGGAEQGAHSGRVRRREILSMTKARTLCPGLCTNPVLTRRIPTVRKMYYGIIQIPKKFLRIGPSSPVHFIFAKANHYFFAPPKHNMNYILCSIFII